MRKILITVFLLFYFISSAHGEGLKGPAHISFADVAIGYSYSFKEFSGSNYEVTNYIRDNLKIEIEPTISAKDELISKDFEPIPDISWVKFEKRQFVLRNGESTQTDFTITIPDEPRYLGKKFQFNIRIKLTDFPQVNAPATKVTIAISEDRISILRLIEQLGVDKLEFDLTPHEYLISDFPLGERVDLSEFTGETFEISNQSEQKYAFGLAVNAGIEPNKTMPPQDFLSLDKTEVILEPHKYERLRPYLFIPDEQDYQNKEFVFIIKAQVIGQTPEQGRTSVITVRTKESKK